MRILIDATTARMGGGITYIRNILPALLLQTGGHKYDVLLSSIYQGDLAKDLPRGINVVTRPIPQNHIGRWLYLQILIPRLLRANRYDLLFSITDISAAYTPCPRVVLVTNESIYAPLKSFPRLSQKIQHFMYRLSRQPLAFLTARGAGRVVFVSDSSRINVTNRLGIVPNRARVVHHGLNPGFNSPSQDSASNQVLETRPFLLTVTSSSQHKNIEALLRGFARIIESGGNEDLQLLIVGLTNSDATRKFPFSEATRLGIVDRVHFTGHVENEHLAPLYRKARVFVLPSRFETFALPLVEAMACGVPIVASDLPVCREVCQEAALYSPPEDDEVFASQILKILDNPAIAEDMSRIGLRRASKFSWDYSAQMLINVFEEVAPKG